MRSGFDRTRSAASVGSRSKRPPASLRSMTMVVPSSQPSLRSSSDRALLTAPVHERAHSIPTCATLRRGLSCGRRREGKQHNQKDRHRSGKSSHSITVSSHRKISRSRGRAPWPREVEVIAASGRPADHNCPLLGQKADFERPIWDVCLPSTWLDQRIRRRNAVRTSAIGETPTRDISDN